MSDCQPVPVSDALALHIDTSDVRSFAPPQSTLQSAPTPLVSLTRHTPAVSPPLYLADYGLTGHGWGRTPRLDSGYNRPGGGLTLFPVSANAGCPSDPFPVRQYPVRTITGGSAGTYIEADGGWLTGEWGIAGHPQRQLPDRYAKGFTCETWLHLDARTFAQSGRADADGFFLFMGARSEDKYHLPWSGDTGWITGEGNLLSPDGKPYPFTYTNDYLRTDPVTGEQYENVSLRMERRFYLTGTTAPLTLPYPSIGGSVRLQANNGGTLTPGTDYTLAQDGLSVRWSNAALCGQWVRLTYATRLIDNFNAALATAANCNPDWGKDTGGNAIGFRLDGQGRPGYRRMGSGGTVSEQYTDTPVMATGWTHLAVTFTPDRDITDPALIGCTPVRMGTLQFRINGTSAGSIENVDEFIFRELAQTPDKQQGVPYSLSWGGGSFGLRHSWHFDPKWVSGATGIFTAGDGGTFGRSITGMTTGGLNTLRRTADDNPFRIGRLSIGSWRIGNSPAIRRTGYSALNIRYRPGIGRMAVRGLAAAFLPGTFTVGTPAAASGNTLLASHRDAILFEPGSRYTATMHVRQSGLFRSGGTLGIRFEGIGEGVWTGRTVTHATSGDSAPGQWYRVSADIEIPYWLPARQARVNLVATGALGGQYDVWVDDVSVRQQIWNTDCYAQDSRKSGLPVETMFGGSLRCGLAVLRIHTRSLSGLEIKRNYAIDAKRFQSRTAGVGGRLIRF